jgi:hypothetical protein
MCLYSGIFMRFAWVVKPRNIHLMVCHMTNETVQLYQLSRWIRAQRYNLFIYYIHLIIKYFVIIIKLIFGYHIIFVGIYLDIILVPIIIIY